MLKKLNKIFFLFQFTLISFLISCAPHTNFHGTPISKFDIENIKIGQTHIDEIIKLYGEPSFSGAFNTTQYYQYEKNEISPAGKKQIIFREILALKMNDEGIITEVKQINLDESENITPVSGKTKTAGSDFTMLQQIFSNLRTGRFAKID